MKCINCGTDNKLKDRTRNQGRCIKCQHQFVFEPISTTSKFTDRFFAKAIADISANNTLFFTPKQLYYILNIRLVNRIVPVPGMVVCGFFILFIGIFPSLFTFHSFPLFVIVVAVGMLLIYFGYFGFVTKPLVFSKTQFEYWLNRWQQINGSILKLLPYPNQKLAPTEINPDVTAYSFDRLVVCDSAVIAQLLIANNFYFENNCAILSITGYPESIFETTMEMLRRNSDLKVYTLHDCSPNGMNLINHLCTSTTWFKDSDITMIDVGLLPRQIIAAKRGMFIQASPESAEAAKQLSPEIRSSLSEIELEWLDCGNFVELESFSPQKLIQILNRGIINSQTLDNDDSSLILVGDSGNSLYVSESFG